MGKRPIIMDCDPGHDDAIAIILAAAREELDILGITTVGGNQTIQKTTKNALSVLTMIGKEIEVAMGADKPLVKKLEIAPNVHGETGLDGPRLPVPQQQPVEKNAADFMAEKIRASSQKVTLVPTGPLTNIAIFLLSYPELKEKIECISLMGGALTAGNWSNAAEFNILVDPEAASIVFKSGIPIVMSGLEVTHRAYFTEQEIAELKASGGKISIFVAELMEFFIGYHKENGWDFAPLHDPCAIAYLVNPDIFKSQDMNVSIDVSGQLSVGRTVGDYGRTDKKVNTKVLYDVEREKFVNLIVEATKYYSTVE